MLLFLVTLLLGVIRGETYDVQPSRSFCFYDDLKPGVTTGVKFETEDKQPINLSITGPSGQVLHETKGESYGSYVLTTRDEGRHKICFANQGSSAVPVTFNPLGDAASAAYGKGKKVFI